MLYFTFQFLNEGKNIQKLTTGFRLPTRAKYAGLVLSRKSLLNGMSEGNCTSKITLPGVPSGGVGGPVIEKH